MSCSSMLLLQGALCLQAASAWELSEADITVKPLSKISVYSEKKGCAHSSVNKNRLLSLWRVYTRRTSPFNCSSHAQLQPVYIHLSPVIFHSKHRPPFPSVGPTGGLPCIPTGRNKLGSQASKFSQKVFFYVLFTLPSIKCEETALLCIQVTKYCKGLSQFSLFMLNLSWFGSNFASQKKDESWWRNGFVLGLGID